VLAEPEMVSLISNGTPYVNEEAGRAIDVDDDRVPNGHPVAMISYAYWRRQFGLSPAVIGRKILISGAPFTIIGVTPPEFFGTEVGTAPEIFAPLMMQPTVEPALENLLEDPMIHRTWCSVLGRLKTGVSPEAAAAGLQVLYRQVTPSVAATSVKRIGAVDWNISLKPAATGLSALRRQFSEALFILMMVVGAVLLIACANLANLLLARAAERRPEFAMRLALGAGRGRLIRQLLVESLVLSIAGGASGIVLAHWMTKLLLMYMSTGRGAIALDLAPDLRVLSFTAGISILTGVLFGLAPALRGTRIDLNTALKGLGNLSSARGGLRPGKILVVFQIAVSLVLVIGAELFVRGLRNLNGTQSADRESVLLIRVEPRGSDQRNIPGTTRRLDAIYRDLMGRVRAIPGVRSVGMSGVTPANPESFAGGPIWLMGLHPVEPFPGGRPGGCADGHVVPEFLLYRGYPHHRWSGVQ
jgi:macrolide transport system ATP-binding/permease protein